MKKRPIEKALAEKRFMEPILKVEGISKSFPGVQALNKVSIDILPGETHVLLGENGAGKSTLVKVIAGIQMPDEGAMEFEGKKYSPDTPRMAAQRGIRMIHQELSVIGSLTVAENIFIDQLPHRRGTINYRALNSAAEKLLNQVGLDVSPTQLAGSLSIAHQQMIEIARALSASSRLIIMDEPTAALTDREIDTLFNIIKALNSDGVSIIYISHRLQEIYRIGNRFTVLRNGIVVGSGLLADVQIDDLVKMMVGRDVGTRGAPTVPTGQLSSELLRVENLVSPSSRFEVSFTLQAGEILGIAGLVGAGRTELLRAIYGADQSKSGEIFISGKRVQIRSPREAVRAGLSLVTENRKEEGLLLEQSCAMNITITDLQRISDRYLVNAKLERESAEQAIEDLGVRTPSHLTPVGNLSGGNQQKIVLAKWIFRDSLILMVDEPTRGIDVGARQEIYQLLRTLAEEGRGILVVSSDLEELMSLSHRILVMSDGRVTGEMTGPDYDEKEILELAFEEYIHGTRAAA